MSQDASLSHCPEKSPSKKSSEICCTYKARCASSRKCLCKREKHWCSLYCHPGKDCVNKPSQCIPVTVDLSHSSNAAVIASEDVWVTIEETPLFIEDRDTLANGAWLNDGLINAAQTLMKIQHPHMAGLQNTLLQQVGCFDVLGEKQFVQVLHVNKNHWITISNVGCKAASIRVFDSLNLSLSPTEIKVIAEILYTFNKLMVIEYADMPFQCGSDDCGLFAIAYACSICNGKDPSQENFTQKMRSHLLKGLEKTSLTPFPSRKRAHKACKWRRQEVALYCTCRLPRDSRQLVQCSTCKEWYHPECLKIPSKYINSQEAWLGNSCI